MAPALIFIVTLFCFQSGAQEIPATRFQLNPHFQFKNIESQSKSDGASGFNLVFENSEFEVQARGTQIKDEAAGKKMIEIELSNIKKIFEAHRNPYEGQITDVVQCDKNLIPRAFSFKLAEQTVNGVVAGANGRKIFGACAYDQLEYWASYFNFYDPASHFVLEFRIFAKIKGAGPAKINKLSDTLRSASKSLVQIRSAP